MQNLVTRYDDILMRYEQNNLLDQHPDQVALFAHAGVDNTASFPVYLEMIVAFVDQLGQQYPGNYGTIIMSKNTGRLMTVLSRLLILKE